MRYVIRTFTAYVVASSLVGGLLLPLFAKSAVADPDGACGPILVLAHSIEHFEVPLEAPSNHCALCHLWNAVANAAVADRAEFAPPESAPNDIGRPRTEAAYLSDISQSPPRGPPSLS